MRSGTKCCTKSRHTLAHLQHPPHHKDHKLANSTNWTNCKIKSAMALKQNLYKPVVNKYVMFLKQTSEADATGMIVTSGTKLSTSRVTDPAAATEI